MSESDQKNEVLIRETVQKYFRGYLSADAELVAEAFDGDTVLITAEDGKPGRTAMADWLSNLRARREKGDFRVADSRIESVTISADAAVVKASLHFAAFSFVDYLSLLRFADGWKIVGKIYTVSA